MESSVKIVKRVACLIARRTIDRAVVTFCPDGNIYDYEVYDNKDVIDMEVLEEMEAEEGQDLVEDVDKAIDAANRMIDLHGRDHIELLVNRTEEEIYVNFHSKHDSFSIYKFDNNYINDDFVINYIKDRFESEDIDVCEY